MTVLHGLVAALTLVLLACLPALLALVITADIAVPGLIRSPRHTGRRLVRRWQAWRWDRLTGLSGPLVPQAPVGPPIERIAADLRRLGRQRAGLAGRSSLWHSAILRSYDARLHAACRELEIVEYLAELSGIDRDIERLRVEGALQAAGLVLTPAGRVRRRGGR